MRHFFLLIGFAFLLNVEAQKVDNLATFRDIKSDNYFRFNYENDYFSGTDENYTQGFSFELVNPSLSKNPANKLFPKLKNSFSKYGLAIEHNGFSPDDIRSKEIQFKDRPFAAAIMLRSFSISTDTIKKTRIVSSLSTGIIGPIAFGREMQIGIHQVIDGAIPGGWRNQIENDLVLNYELGYNKQVVHWKNLFLLEGNSRAKIGTYRTDASLGITSALGLINNPYSSKKKKFQLYIYAQPLGNLVGYDATLQGGLFNKNSSYTVPTNNIERFTFQFNYGLMIKIKGLYLEYSRTTLTSEYESIGLTKWGGVRIGFDL